MFPKAKGLRSVDWEYTNGNIKSFAFFEGKDISEYIASEVWESFSLSMMSLQKTRLHLPERENGAQAIGAQIKQTNKKHKKRQP